MTPKGTMNKSPPKESMAPPLHFIVTRNPEAERTSGTRRQLSLPIQFPAADADELALACCINRAAGGRR